jgi:hypothetical protein
MALSQYTRGLAYRSIFAHLSLGTPEGDIIDRVMAKYTTLKESDRAQLNTILNSAKRSHAAAGEIESGTRGAGDIAGIPIDWSDNGTGGRYRYRVLISTNDTSTGERYDTVVVVSSSRTLDRADIIALAEQSSVSAAVIRAYPNRTDYLAPQSVTTYQVVGAGRRV